MATEYPTALLPIWQRGFKLSPSDNGQLRSVSSTGRARQRQVGESRDDQYEFALVLTPDELVYFEHFVIDQINYCAEFQGPYHTGSGTETGTVRFVGGEYTVRQMPNAPLFEVNATVEVIDRSV